MVIIMVLLGLLLSDGEETGNIYGFVDYHGHPMIGATVLISGTSIGAMTDANGIFRIDDLTVGEYTFEFRMVGFKSETIDGIEVEAGSTIQLDVSLSVEDPLQSDPVILIKI